jgi:hypothetical protein
MRSPIAFLILVVLTTGCPKPADTPLPLDIQAAVVYPDREYNFQMAYAQALNCDPATLVWSIPELGGAGTVNSIDGWITQAGVYHSPSCGSLYIGAFQHVSATCPATNQSGSAIVNIGQELLRTISVVAAVVRPGASDSCYDHTGFCTPNGSTIPGSVACDMFTWPDICATGDFCQLSTTVNANDTVNWYARLIFSCTTAYSPPLPTVPPAVCVP